jgi:signal transduction histidine kinase
LVDVNQVIREISALLQHEARMSSVAVRMDLAKEAPRVAGDRVQLQQVVMNLMLNAQESMKEKGGDLVVRSEMTETGEVLISVSDTGVGLPAGAEERIFDAFFTTKSQGTGMGLAICRSIMESHGGRLSAHRNAGPGATFYVELPQYVGKPA